MKPTDASVTKDDGGGEGEKFAVGKVYAVKLITGDEFKGIVLAYDPDGPDPNFVIFEEGTKPKAGHVKTTRTVNENLITELKFLAKVKDPLAGKKRSIDLDELRLKESLAISKIVGMGIGVTKEGKKIYDALAKTFPVKWDNTDIVVNEEVRVHSPYHPDCVIGGTAAANAQLKKVLVLVGEKLDFSSGTGGY